MSSPQPPGSVDLGVGSPSKRSQEEEEDTKMLMLLKIEHVACNRECHCRPLLKAVMVDTEDWQALTDSIQPVFQKQAGLMHPEEYDRPVILLFRIEWEGHDEHPLVALELMFGEDFKNQFRMIRARGFRDTLVASYIYANSADYLGYGDSMIVDDGQYDDMDEADERPSVVMETEEEDAKDHENNSPSPPGCSDKKWQLDPPATPARAPLHSTQSGLITVVLYGAEKDVLAEMPLKNSYWLRTLADKPTWKALALAILSTEIDQIGANRGPYLRFHGSPQSSIHDNLGTPVVNEGSDGGSPMPMRFRKGPAMTRLAGIGRGSRVVNGRRASSAPIALRPAHADSALKHSSSPMRPMEFPDSSLPSPSPSPPPKGSPKKVDPVGLT
ncbi:hypothetical protein F5Y14DRAFT_146026 [Nemania sp. NC0429]|nr:hypothetical protein F5Y14DRAFT_146026 [Nemania sp. NC0429]